MQTLIVLIQYIVHVLMQILNIVLQVDVIVRVEAAIQPLLGSVSARCRLTGEGFHIEIDAAALGEMNEKHHAIIRAAAQAELRPSDSLSELRPYKQGSAFVHEGIGHG